MKTARFDDWGWLHGVNVEVWQSGRLLRKGYVDAATDDAAIAWITAHGADNRLLIEKAEGHELRIDKDQWVLRAEGHTWHQAPST
jgi:hypothetical protein